MLTVLLVALEFFLELDFSLFLLLSASCWLVNQKTLPVFVSRSTKSGRALTNGTCSVVVRLLFVARVVVVRFDKRLLQLVSILLLLLIIIMRLIILVG